MIIPINLKLDGVVKKEIQIVFVTPTDISIT